MSDIKFNPPFDKTFPVVRVNEHWEFEAPPEGVDRVADPREYWFFRENGHMVAQKITPALVKEVEDWSG